MIEMTAAAKAYVRFVLGELKLSATALAKGAGLAPTTLTRALNDPEHQFSLSTTTINKIAQFSGINPAPFFEAKDFVQMSMAPYERTDFYDESWGVGANASPEKSKEGHLSIIIGEAAAGVWKDPKLTKLEEGEFLWATLPNSHDVDVFGVRMGDTSASRYLQEGEYALCARASALDRPLYHGNLVVVERWRSDAPLMELSIRRLIVPEGGDPYLRMESRDPKFSEKIPYPNLANTERLKVIGIVAWAMRSVNDPKLDEEARIKGLRERGHID